jgi:hypothetical protein
VDELDKMMLLSKNESHEKMKIEIQNEELANML